VNYVTIDDRGVRGRLFTLSKKEGIIPALESAQSRGERHETGKGKEAAVDPREPERPRDRTSTHRGEYAFGDLLKAPRCAEARRGLEKPQQRARCRATRQRLHLWRIRRSVIVESAAVCGSPPRPLKKPQSVQDAAATRHRLHEEKSGRT
jgi:hypothetical protein